METSIFCRSSTDNDLFLDQLVYTYLYSLLKIYAKPSVLDRLNVDEKIPGLTSFYDL